MKIGLYRNKLGAEMHVTGSFAGTAATRTIGGIYWAENRESFFGPMQYLVTPQSMIDAGYELVEEEEVPHDA